MGSHICSMIKLLERLEYEGLIPQDGRVRGVCCDSRTLKKGELFVCIKGKEHDGHFFLKEAERKGAVAVVVQKNVQASIPVVKVEDTGRAYSIICSNFHGRPSQRMKIIAITGTSGKTTTAYFIQSILSAAGKKAGMLSTIVYKIGEEELPSSYTTPPPHILFPLLQRMVEGGMEHCIMEVSSHALKQGRVDGVEFDIAVFTNISEEHLEFHKDFEEYKFSKARLFHLLSTSSKKGKVAVINVDDVNSPYFLDAAKGVKCITFGRREDAHFKIEDVRVCEEGMLFQIGGDSVQIKLLGMQNVYNAAAAYCVGRALSIEREVIIEGLKNLEAVEGRFEVLQRSPFWVVIDYSHKVDALKSALETARALAKGKVITVFGCGGGRWKEKRRMMGEVGARLSDILFVTSDNPRDEDPQLIIKQIVEGTKKGAAKVFPIVDREEAIKEAVSVAAQGDILLICGKGHERVQIVGGRRIPFSDKEVAQRYLRRA